MTGFALICIAIVLWWWMIMATAALLLPHDVGRFLANVRNGYDLWRDRKYK